MLARRAMRRGIARGVIELIALAGHRDDIVVVPLVGHGEMCGQEAGARSSTVRPPLRL